MSYHSVKCELPAATRKKLVQGQAVALKPSMIGSGTHVMHLTKTQMNRLSKGKGVRLQWSRPQLKHNLKHGAGFLDFLKNAAKQVIGPVLDAGKNLAKGAADKLIDNTIAKIPGIGGPLAELAKQGKDAGLDYGASKINDKVQGLGLKGRKKRGAGVARSRAVGVVKSDGQGLYLPGSRGGFCGTKFPGLPGSRGAGLVPPPIKSNNTTRSGI